MSWFRIDDSFWSHRKARRAKAEALGLWAACGSYASSSACDDSGLVTFEDAEFVAAAIGAAKSLSRLAKALVESGLWEVHPRGYLFHDWDDYRQGGEAELDRRKERDAERKRVARKKRDEDKLSADVSADIGKMSADAVLGISAEMSAPPDPSRPVLPVPSFPPNPQTPSSPARVDDPGGMLTSAYTEAVKSVVKTPQTRLSPLDSQALHEVAAVHAEGLRGQALLEWVAKTAREFAIEQAKAPQFGGFKVRTFATWLDAGRPSVRAPPAARRESLRQGAVGRDTQFVETE